MANTTSSLVVAAGTEALTQIREEGLPPGAVRVVAGASGGPKGLVLLSLDKALFSGWFDGRTSPLYLIGSSIGAWRLAAACRREATKATEKLQHAYIGQTYAGRPTAREVTAESARIMEAYLGKTGPTEILAHPYLRMGLLAARSRFAVSSDRKLPLACGLALAASANLISRRLLGLFFERALFCDPRDTPPFAGMDTLPIRRIALTGGNFHAALLASGAIPLVMDGITDIPNAPPGTYRDGGITDYHLDIPFIDDGPGLVLYPHFFDHIIPGWFDKKLAWRKPSPDHLKRVVLIHPSPNFVKRLPGGRIPDRSDFRRFYGRDRERMDCWQKVVKEGEKLAEEFMEITASGKIRHLAKPLKM